MVESEVENTCLTLANFGVTMKECMEMAELEWEFHINNQALLEATAKLRAKPSALKPIDKFFWAPGMQTRGKRKRILADDDDDQEDSRTEDPLSSSVASQAILGVGNSADDRIAADRAGGWRCSF